MTWQIIALGLSINEVITERLNSQPRSENCQKTVKNGVLKINLPNAWKLK